MMDNRFYEIKIKGATIHITANEVNKLLLKDTAMYSDILKRSKYINRHQEQKSREQAKWERENEN